MLMMPVAEGEEALELLRAAGLTTIQHDCRTSHTSMEAEASADDEGV